MVHKKFTMKDWHIPFMLFELSSYAQNKEKERQRERADNELVTEMNDFFNDDNAGGAMDFFWNNLQIGED